MLRWSKTLFCWNIRWPKKRRSFWRSWEIFIWFPTTAQKVYGSTYNVSHTYMSFWRHLLKIFRKTCFETSFIAHLLLRREESWMTVDIAVTVDVWTGSMSIIKLGSHSALRQMILIGMWSKCVRLALNDKRTYKVTWNAQWAKLLCQKSGTGGKLLLLDAVTTPRSHQPEYFFIN